MVEIKFAPREVFEQLLEWGVMPTFDLIIDVEGQGVILVKRKIAPYENQWALPGLRMYKGEEIKGTLERIAKQELGLGINQENKIFIGQYVGKFITEHNRQDLSTCYYVKVASSQSPVLNENHFFSLMYIKSKEDIPSKIGAMYKFYLTEYFGSKK